jgi:hypothetical protein
MATACQNGAKVAWRKYGKAILKLERELGIPSQKWMLEAFKE